MPVFCMLHRSYQTAKLRIQQIFSPIYMCTNLIARDSWIYNLSSNHTKLISTNWNKNALYTLNYFVGMLFLWKITLIDPTVLCTKIGGISSFNFSLIFSYFFVACLQIYVKKKQNIKNFKYNSNDKNSIDHLHISDFLKKNKKIKELFPFKAGKRSNFIQFKVQRK